MPIMLGSSPPRKKAAALQSSLVASFKWSEDWVLIPNPSKSELIFGDTSYSVTYSLTTCTSSNAQSIQPVNTVLELRLLLKSQFSADDSFALSTKKNPWNVFFLPKAILRNPDP